MLAFLIDDCKHQAEFPVTAIGSVLLPVAALVPGYYFGREGSLTASARRGDASNIAAPSAKTTRAENVANGTRMRTCHVALA